MSKIYQQVTRNETNIKHPVKRFMLVKNELSTFKDLGQEIKVYGIVTRLNTGKA